MTLRSLVVALLCATPASAQTNPYTWQTTAGNWSAAGNWLNGVSVAEVPPSSATTQLVFNASGPTAYTSTHNLGSFTLNRLTINNDSDQTLTIAPATPGDTLTFAGTNPTIHVTDASLTLTTPVTLPPVLTILGTGFSGVAFDGGVVLGGTGTIHVQHGALGILGTAVLGGTGPITLTAASMTFNNSGTSARPITVNAAGGTVYNFFSGSVRTNTAPLTLNGTFNLTGGGDWFQTAAVSGPGTLAVTGGVFHAQGDLPLTGDILAFGGTVRLFPGQLIGGRVENHTGFSIASGDGSVTLTVPRVRNLGFIQFELNTDAVPTAPLLTISTPDGYIDGFNFNFRLANTKAFPVNQPFTLMEYSGGPIGPGNPSTLQLSGRAVGNVIFDIPNTRIDAVVTSGIDPVHWGGQTNGTWDKGTAAGTGGTSNFRLTSNNGTTNFIDLDLVTFDDTASGNFTVTLSGTLNPAAVTVNNTANAYTFAGTGSLAGSMTLVKQGTGLLTVATTNSYYGGTTVTAGTLRVANTVGFVTSSATGTGAVDVNTGATLDGTGRVGGLTRLNAGGTLQAGTGSATDTLTLAGGLTLDGTNTLRVVVGDGTVGNGVADPVAGRIVTDRLGRNTGGPADLTTIKLVGTPGQFDLGQTYTVIVATFNSSADLSATDFAVDPNPEGFTVLGTPSLAFDTTLNQLRVTFVPTPEPGTVFGVLAGLLAGGGWVRQWLRKP